jgi:hypothetical protein
VTAAKREAATAGPRHSQPATGPLGLDGLEALRRSQWQAQLVAQALG